MDDERELQRRAGHERSEAFKAQGAMERNIIERALELAPKCRSLPELKSRLKSEGYTSIDAHFHGRHIKNQIKELLEGGQLTPAEGRYPKKPAANKPAP